MTDKPTITQADRDAAWFIRPDCYGKAEYDNWRLGVYDGSRCIQDLAKHRENAAAELQAENERLRIALRTIMEMPGEINPANYDEQDVETLNNSHIEAYSICKAALAQKEPVE